MKRLVKRETEKMKRFPRFFSCLYSRVKIFVFGVNGKRHFSIFVLFDLFKDYKQKNKNLR